METKRKDKTQQFLALAAFSAEVLGTLLCVLTMLGGGQMLPVWLKKLYMATGDIIALGCLTVYFCLRNTSEQSGLQKIRQNWLAVLKEELWILVIFYLWMALDEIRELIYRSFLPDGIPWNIVASLVLSCTALFAISLFLDRLVRKNILKKTRKSPKRILKSLCILAFAFIVRIVLMTIEDMALEVWMPSVVGMLALHIFNACCGYGLLVAMLHMLCRDSIGNDASGTEAVNGASDVLPECQEKIPADGADDRMKEKLGVCIPLIMAALLAFLTGNRGSVSVEERMRASIEGPLEEGYGALWEGNMEGAVSAFDLSEARIHAYESVVDENSGYSLEPIYNQYQDDIVISVLYLSERDSIQQLEGGIRNHTLGMEWYPALLRHFCGLEEHTDIQKILQEEMLLKLAAAERYTEEGPLFAGDLEDGKMAAVSVLKGYREELAACSMFRLMLQYGTQGGYTAELTEQALNLAEANQDSLLLQYIAYQIGSSYRVDEAWHYGRTLEAIQRFDRMFDDGTRTEEQIAMEKYDLGEAAAGCYAYEAALGYYEASYALSNESGTALQCARICEKLGNYERCAEMAGNCLQLDPDNTQALYLAALSALKTRDTETVLEMAGKLGDLTAGPNGNTETESCLYSCVQYLAMDDSARWTDYQYRIYDSMTEEQIEETKTHALLWDYMTAMYQCFTTCDYEKAAESAERILSVRDDLPMGWYLKGTIAFGAKDFGTALESFQKAEECGGTIPALYFSIANTYDAMGDYENALNYSRKVENALPYQDHGGDVYGISYHNRNLYNALKSRMEE